jgi:chitinase
MESIVSLSGERIVYSSDTRLVDWEHPSNAQEGQDFIRLLSILRQALPLPRYSLTTALPIGEWALQHIDLRATASIVDLINLMAYDYSGPWTQTADHHANLFARSPQAQGGVSGDAGIEYVLRRGVPAHKILLGVPCYGRSFLEASGPSQPFNGAAGEEGTFEYRDLPRPGTVEQVDRAVGAAYCIGGDGGFVTYDNAETVSIKADYVKRRGLAGLFYWTGTGDTNDDRRSLVLAGYLGLHST